ncbi:6,7-dimethyl-8-ribityllumazine synthase [Deinobacterium chartae]|uniref:6,7-dimethyl-8-ribityllumazine synthase n=1 Tax=Deinobacterium chartae TaxID=521158 RepID=A0A841I1F3_9DEIO|nr:6,7-dimethyl-8-ribityllumazine synthase [Deinobacterium chartae]MBB6098229.1 6,7-dimethyl-8-ribityllumazine synthase [Deinobacterium chartae]
MKTIEADLIARDLKIAIVHTRWNHFIVDRLLEGAETAFRQHGGQADHLEAYCAPGAFELPLIAKRLAQSGRFDAVVCLGAVIRGATDHYDFVAGNAASGLAGVSLETGVPVMFGLLTTDTIEQAIERAGTKAGNKGAEAVLAAIETVNLLRRIDG